MDTLEDIKATVFQEYQELLADLENGLLGALYLEVNAIVGMAATAHLPGMDRAAFSLCDLLDRMGTPRR